MKWGSGGGGKGTCPSYGKYGKPWKSVSLNSLLIYLI